MSRRWPTRLGVALAVATGPLALYWAPRPALEVRQRPWSQSTAALPVDAAPGVGAGAPGQLFRLDEPHALRGLTSIEVALVAPPGSTASSTVALHLQAGPTPSGPFTEVARTAVTTTRAALVGGSFLHFPLTIATDTPAPWLRFQLTQDRDAPVAAILRRRGTLGTNRGWGPAVRAVRSLEGDFRSPLAGLSGLDFLGTRVPLELPLDPAARSARLTLRTSRSAQPPNVLLRTVAIVVPTNAADAWLHFDFDPLAAGYRLPLEYLLELPAGTALRGAQGQPSLRSFHGGGLNLAGGALDGEALDPHRDLVFRVWTHPQGPLLRDVRPHALLGLGLGLTLLAWLGARLLRPKAPEAT